MCNNKTQNVSFVTVIYIIKKCLDADNNDNTMQVSTDQCFLPEIWTEPDWTPLIYVCFLHFKLILKFPEEASLHEKMKSKTPFEMYKEIYCSSEPCAITNSGNNIVDDGLPQALMI